MKKRLKNQRGSIAVNVYVLVLIIFTILVSALTIIAKDYETVQSNSSSIRAYYMAETAMEEALHQLVALTHRGIMLYLEEVKVYKIDFVNRMQAAAVTKENYAPPELQTFLQQEVVNQLSSLNASVENPFGDYPHFHSYKKNFTYISDQNIIEIYTTGQYNQAKRYIRAQVKLPIQSKEGIDVHHLPNIKISSLKITSLYQTY